MVKKSKPEKRKKRKILRIVLISLVVLLVIFRILLPYIVLKYVNRQLSQMKDYYGHVEDIDIRLYRGAYIINDIKIMRIEADKTAHDTIPFFDSPKIDLSIEWKSLFKGRVVGEIYVEKPVLNFVKGKHKDEDLKSDTSDFKELIKDLMPITVNHFEINDGEIHFIDPYAKPRLDIFMHDIYIVALNLSNVNKSNEVLPATVTARGSLYEGAFNLNIKLDALAKQPTFDLNAELKTMNMVSLNDMLREYGNFDVKKGNFSLYTEFAGKDGKFGGYVKPIVKDLDVVQWNKEEGNLGQIAWETLVGSLAEIFQNQSKEQLATKVNIEGRFDNPHINTWRAIAYVLRNAFLRALKASIDESININNLGDEKDKTLLEKIFSGKDKDEKKKKKSDKK